MLLCFYFFTKIITKIKPIKAQTAYISKTCALLWLSAKNDWLTAKFASHRLQSKKSYKNFALGAFLSSNLLDFIYNLCDNPLRRASPSCNATKLFILKPRRF